MRVAFVRERNEEFEVKILTIDNTNGGIKKAEVWGTFKTWEEADDKRLWLNENLKKIEKYVEDRMLAHRLCKVKNEI